MTNEELKKKIVEVVLNSEITGIQIRAITGGYSMANNIADALIAAGIGDTTNLIVENEVLQRDVDNLTRTLEEGTEELQEVQHRADVAERALRNLAQLCAKAARFYLRSNKAVKERERELYDEWINNAEKELSEEKKG